MDNAERKIAVVDFDGTINIEETYPLATGQPSKDWLIAQDLMGFVDTVNENLAPWNYDSRKIYGHMYVDDRAYGFDPYDEDVLLDVVVQFSIKVLGWTVAEAMMARKMIDEGNSAPTRAEVGELIYDN